MKEYRDGGTNYKSVLADVQTLRTSQSANLAESITRCVQPLKFKI